MRTTNQAIKPKQFTATSTFKFFDQLNQWLRAVDSDRSDYKDEAVLEVIVPSQLRSIITDQCELRAQAGRPGGIYVSRPVTVKLIHA